MAWYLNRYVCPECNASWEDEWSAMSDDSCPDCECSDVTPTSSDDLSVNIDLNANGDCVVWVSRDDADESPKYVSMLTIPAKTLKRVASTTCNDDT